MKKLTISLFTAAIALFAVVLYRVPAGASADALAAQSCKLTTGNWFCFSYNGVDYYTNCSSSGFPHPIDRCVGREMPKPDNTKKHVPTSGQ
ncbi:MAG: hypothetical protein JO306_11900 [Gemmatimonadetes bacterium]|nr:hypothetical protein [Gemmatimonadota bacterium]